MLKGFGTVTHSVVSVQEVVLVDFTIVTGARVQAERGVGAIIPAELHPHDAEYITK